MHKRMFSLDDLPKRDDNSWIETKSDIAFRKAVSENREFIVRSEDSRDYGTDFQLEATDSGTMTNVRVHVQLKGTRTNPNADGSVSLQIKRTNLNYLAMQEDSILVCYHVPSARLLVREVDDVFREHEHLLSSDVAQDTVTVRFDGQFDASYQEYLKAQVIVHAKSARNRRLHVDVAPPEGILLTVDEGPFDLSVPTDPTRAERLLVTLYDAGRDSVISHYFDTFRTTMGTSSGSFLLAYLAEINLGINGKTCNERRIREGITLFTERSTVEPPLPGATLYNIGNAWFALKNYERAAPAYRCALRVLNARQSPDIVARCCKNLGSVVAKMGRPEEARSLYSRALALVARFPEAHYALALWHIRHGTDLVSALHHLDSIVWPAASPGTSPSILGWRAEILFRLGRIAESFREINTLLSISADLDWVWPWCTKLVATYGRTTLMSTKLSAQFWDRYANAFPDDLRGRREKLLCYCRIHDEGGDPKYSLEDVKQAVADLVGRGVANPAFLWDRAGHWAQNDGNWYEAENCYRRAYELSPAEYGYCLGTALNSLQRYPEALPILLEQAQKHQPDALSWFQVALAREGTGDVKGCINAYKRALQHDENYALAWFNIGGVMWNAQYCTDAISTWREAIRRFPRHELSQKLRDDLAVLRTE